MKYRKYNIYVETHECLDFPFQEVVSSSQTRAPKITVGIFSVPERAIAVGLPLFPPRLADCIKARLAYL